MWSNTVGLVNGKYRYLTAETFGFKVNSNGQLLKKRQQWTIEPFCDSSIGLFQHESPLLTSPGSVLSNQRQPQQSASAQQQHSEPYDPYILTLNSNGQCSSLNSVKSSSNGSTTSDQDACSEEHENVAIKSHLNKYLAVDSFGNVTCDSDEKTDNARFTITICSMSQGRSKEEQIFWAFKNVERGYFLGTSEDGNVCCNAKMPKSRAELWLLHLIPARGASFFALKSLGRKRFARVVDETKTMMTSINGVGGAAAQATGQVQLDATTSWGPETLFQFKFHEGGLYSLLTSDCRYLTNEGRCIIWKGISESSSLSHSMESTCNNNSNKDISGTTINLANLPPKECLFTLEYHNGFLAFRDSFSHYLAGAGRTSLLRSRSTGVSRDELFLFESAPIQVSLKATFNNRWVSIKQGVDLSANQLEASSTTETFQMTYHLETSNWSIMTHECDFWNVLQQTGTISICKMENYEALDRGQFRVVWSDSEATCSLKFVDGGKAQNREEERWVGARKSGQLYLAPSGGQVAPVKFIMRFQNRKLLNLRPVNGNGFVGLKSGSCSRQLEATKTSPDSIAIEYSELLSSNVLSNETTILNNNGGFTPEGESILTNHDFLTPLQEKVKPLNGKRESSANQHQFARNGFLKSTTAASNNLTASQFGAGQVTRQDDNDDYLANLDQAKQLIDQDDNNNNCFEVENKMMAVGQQDENGQQELSGGSVESAPIASVASIISSFSAARVSGTGNGTTSAIHRQQYQSPNGPVKTSSSRVSKLASSFDGGHQQQQQQQDNHITPKQIISPTTASGHYQTQQNKEYHIETSSSVIKSSHQVSSNTNQTLITEHNQDNNQQPEKQTTKLSTSERLAQFECCYLKVMHNNRYLVVGDKDASIVCDAVNRACAQPWIIELRSHNSIAIRASDDHAYMQLGTNGTISLSRCEPHEASLWEF